MTMLSRRAEAEAVQPETQIPDPTPAEARGRAESVPTALSRIQLRNADGDAASRAREWLERVPVWQAKAAARLAVLGQMAIRPPSVTELHAAHREAAAQWNAPLARWPRHLWGAAHTAAYTAAYGTLAVAFSPAGFLLAVAFLVVCWLWL